MAASSLSTVHVSSWHLADWMALSERHANDAKQMLTASFQASCRDMYVNVILPSILSVSLPSSVVVLSYQQ
jgi:hypothetical protein